MTRVIPLERTPGDAMDHGIPVQRSIGDGKSRASFPPPAWLEGLSANDARALRLPPTASSPAAARAFVRETLLRWRLDSINDIAAVIVSELVTNVVQHGRTKMILTITRTAGGVRLALVDRADGMPTPRQAGATDEGGRGLALVEALSQRYGTTRLPRGKRVWADIAAPTTSRSRGRSGAAAG
jgi:serine/threonine-protein kinase RsbW